MTKHAQTRYDAAARYITADKSDPFAAARIATHMRNGVCGFTQKGEEAFYTAEMGTEERVTADGKPYTAVVYKNRVRP